MIVYFFIKVKKKIIMCKFYYNLKKISIEKSIECALL